MDLGLRTDIVEARALVAATATGLPIRPSKVCRVYQGLNRVRACVYVYL